MTQKFKHCSRQPRHPGDLFRARSCCPQSFCDAGSPRVSEPLSGGQSVHSLSYETLSPWQAEHVQPSHKLSAARNKPRASGSRPDSNITQAYAGVPGTLRRARGASCWPLLKWHLLQPLRQRFTTTFLQANPHSLLLRIKRLQGCVSRAFRH